MLDGFMFYFSLIVIPLFLFYLYFYYKWLRKNYYYKGGLQWAYKDIKPRLVVEKFLEDKEVKELIDYKFYCFNGEPKFLVAQSDKLGKYFYDLHWNFLPFSWRKKI